MIKKLAILVGVVLLIFWAYLTTTHTESRIREIDAGWIMEERDLLGHWDEVLWSSIGSMNEHKQAFSTREELEQAIRYSDEFLKKCR